MLGANTEVISGTHCELVVNDYKVILKSVIPIIKNGLQQMEITYPLSSYCGGYGFEKVINYFINGDIIGKVLFNKFVEKSDLPSILTECNEINLKQLVFDSYIYRKSTELGRKIKLEELIGNDDF